MEIDLFDGRPNRAFAGQRPVGTPQNRREAVIALDTNGVAFEPVISAVEAGKLLGIHPVTLLRWAREGKVPFRRLGRRVTFRVSELDSWYTRSTLEEPFVSPNRKGEGT
jgi:excisionase family DNA binding protein